MKHKPAHNAHNYKRPTLGRGTLKNGRLVCFWRWRGPFGFLGAGGRFGHTPGQGFLIRERGHLCGGNCADGFVSLI